MKLRAIDVINDKAFHAANLTMKSICNAFLRSGGRVKHYDAIESDDLKKLGKHFDRSNPVRLQEEVYINIIYYYGNRGREWMRGLRFDFFVRSGSPMDSTRLSLFREIQRIWLYQRRRHG